MDLGPLGGRFPFNPPPLVREGAELGSIPTHSGLEDPMCGRLGKGGGLGIQKKEPKIGPDRGKEACLGNGKKLRIRIGRRDLGRNPHRTSPETWGVPLERSLFGERGEGDRRAVLRLGPTGPVTVRG